MFAVPDDDVFSLAEIAAAARVSPTVVLDLAARGSLPIAGPGPLSLESLVTRDHAIDSVRALASGSTVGAGTRAIVAVAPEVPRPSGVPVLVSTGLHGLAALAIAVVASLGWSLRADAPPDEVVSHEPTRLVFLALPGPGGGGGGGGLRQKAPPPKVQREGTHSLSSPLPGPRAAAPGAHRKAARSARSRRPSSRRSPRRPPMPRRRPACCARRLPHRNRPRDRAMAVGPAPARASASAKAAARASATALAAAWAAGLTVRAAASNLRGC